MVRILLLPHLMDLQSPSPLEELLLLTLSFIPRGDRVDPELQHSFFRVKLNPPDLIHDHSLVFRLYRPDNIL